MVVIFEERNEVLLDAVDPTVVVVIGYAGQMDVEGLLSKHGYQDQVLKKVPYRPGKAAVEMQFHSLVIGDESRVELH